MARDVVHRILNRDRVSTVSRPSQGSEEQPPQPPPIVLGREDPNQLPKQGGLAGKTKCCWKSSSSDSNHSAVALSFRNIIYLVDSCVFLPLLLGILAPPTSLLPTLTLTLTLILTPFILYVSLALSLCCIVRTWINTLSLRRALHESITNSPHQSLLVFSI